MSNDSILYWLWLSERCGVASHSFGKLMEHYEDPFDLYRLEVEEIEQLEGISQHLKQRLADKSLDFSYQVKYDCAKGGYWILPYGDPRYPERLKKLEDPPVLLYGMGELPDLNGSLCIGMVGTRRMSEYGRDSAYKISYELAAAGTVIVSGMALGIDGISAVGALAAGGKTVAVLGGGFEKLYPKEHATLMRAIAKQGAVLSEYPPKARSYPGNFPQRNRIVSGLCQGLFVVEGAMGSGALITAKLAQAQGRDVFALPGNIDESNSDGPNDLIQRGATPVRKSDDILERYDFLYHDRMNYPRWQNARRQTYPEALALEEYGVSAEILTRGRRSSRTTAPEEKKAVSGRTEPVKTMEETVSTVSSMSKEEEASLNGLDPLCRKVFESMPIDRPVSPDELISNEVSISEVMTAMTILEVSGFCMSLPGGMFARK